MNPSDYVASYYAASKNPSPLRPQLTGTVECDVCVVGAGIAGTSAALHLAERFDHNIDHRVFALILMFQAAGISTCSRNEQIS